jgi:hypothetical protein
MKQTAVEWLIEELEQSILITSSVKTKIKQAKEMEKRHIIDAYHINPLETKWSNIGEQYYNEIFKHK